MIQSPGTFILLILISVKFVSTLDYPQCDDSGNICHLASGRDCMGYQDLQNVDSLDWLWIKQNQKQIAIAKKEVTFDQAVEICKSLCGKLYEPDDVSETYQGFSQTCYDHDIGNVLIGVMAHKNDTDTFYYYLSDENTIFAIDDSNFIDETFHLSTALFRNGDYPLVILTGSVRYNKWDISNIDSKYYFACEMDTVQDVTEPPVKSSFFDNLKNKFEFFVSPKLNLNDGDKTLALLTNPKNIWEAEEFCKIYANGNLYDIESSFQKVVDFANHFGVHAFYISLSDKHDENNFIYPNGKQLESDFDSLWLDGEPDNYMPMTHNFCESTGEDHVIIQDGKLSDVRGFRRFPFFCQFIYPPIVNDTLGCPSCTDFFKSLPISSMKSTIFQNFQQFCEKQLGILFSSKSRLVCNLLNKALKEAMKYFEEKFINTNEICNFSVFKHCNLSPIETGIDNCLKCKLIANMIKKMSFGVILDQSVGKYFPYMTFLISKLCSETAECNQLDIEALIKKLFLFQTEAIDFSNLICSKIGLCA